VLTLHLSGMRSVLFPSLIVLTIGSFLEISSAPIPTEVIEGTKAETAEAPANDPTKETQDPKRTGKKLTVRSQPACRACRLK